METSTIELVMKGMTFLGVALAGALVSARHETARALARDAAVGALGVVLMFGNARLGAGALGVAVDACYLGFVGALLTRRARVARRARQAAAPVAQPAPIVPAR